MGSSMNVSSRHLRAFVAIARAGNFTAAAAKLNLSQSSLTKTIHELPGVWSALDNGTTVTNLDLQISLVREGVGACILSALAASHPSARSMPFRLIDQSDLYRDVYLFTRKGAQLTPATETLVSVLCEVLPRLDFAEGVAIDPSLLPGA